MRQPPSIRSSCAAGEFLSSHSGATLCCSFASHCNQGQTQSPVALLRLLASQRSFNSQLLSANRPSFQGVNRLFFHSCGLVCSLAVVRLSQLSYSTQPNRLHSQAFSVEPGRTILAFAFLRLSLTLLFQTSSVLPPLFVSQTCVYSTEALTCRYNPLSCPDCASHRIICLLMATVVAGSVSPMSARYLLVTCALAVRRHCYGRLMSVINLSSPTAVAGRIRIDKQLTNAMFTRLQPVDRLPNFQPLFAACFWRRDIVYHEMLILSRKFLYFFDLFLTNATFFIY